MIAAAEPVLPTDTANSAPVKAREGDGAALAAAQPGAGPHSARADAGAPAASQNTYPATARDPAARSKEGSEVGSAAAHAVPAPEVAAVVPAPALEQRHTAEAQIAKIDEAAQADVGSKPTGARGQGTRTGPCRDGRAVADEAGVAGDHELGRRPRLDGMQFAQVVVRGGDSVSGIAMRKYGQATYTILDLLKLANPELKDINVITIGQTIRLPELGDTLSNSERRIRPLLIAGVFESPGRARVRPSKCPSQPRF